MIYKWHFTYGTLVYNLTTKKPIVCYVLQIGEGTYSNVFKGRDLLNGKVVAMKKVRFDTLEPESVRFMAREIIILRRLNHPNVIKLQNIAISRESGSLYLVFEYMDYDLGRILTSSQLGFTVPQVSMKSYTCIL